MSNTESRELTITDTDGGSSITLTRDGGTVKIESAYFYTNHQEQKSPLVLDGDDRVALMDFLNMGEYRKLSYEERR